MSARLSIVLAAAIVTVAVALRLGNLGAGIPYAVGVDEPEIMERAVRMMKTGDFNPHFFDWPSLTIYLQFLVSCTVFLLGSMQAHWNHLDQVGAADVYLAGRALSALVGSATVWVTYLIGRRWGQAEGVLAAALMAVIPYHVRESHYVLADVPTAFLTSLTCLLALRGHERPTSWAFAAAGLSAGLAASSKYNGSIALLFPLLAAWLTEGAPRVRAQRTLAIVGAALCGFLVGTPYALLDLPKFLNDYARLAAIFARERAGEPGWSIYLKHLRGALGWPALVMTFAGMALMMVRSVIGPDRLRAVLVLAFSVVYFTVMAGSYQIYGRYVLPLLPMASLMTAVATVAAIGLFGRLHWRRSAIGLLATAVVVTWLAVPAWTSVQFVRDLGRPGTVDLAYRWIDANVPAGSKVVLERRVLLLPAPKYETVNLPSLLRRSYDEFVSDGFDYMVASSFEEPFAAPQDHREAYLAYRELFSRAQLVASFYRSGEVTGPAVAVYKLSP